jgi:hypothetical protein
MTEKKELWRIMTALRGPDRQGKNASPVKGQSTARIRWAVFGSDAIGWTADIKGIAPGSEKELRGLVGWHFASHYRDACIAIQKAIPSFKMWEPPKLSGDGT